LNGVELPPKHVLYSMAMEPDDEFLRQRQAGLSAYLDKVIRTVGSADIGFWNHPIVMTFLDMPLAGFAMNSEIDSVREWEREMAAAHEALAKAQETAKTRLVLQIRGADTGNYTKQLRRQLVSLQKKTERLHTGMLNLQKDPETGHLDMEALRERRRRVEVVQVQCTELGDGLVGGLESPVPVLAETAPMKTPPTPTSARAHLGLPEDIADALRHQETALDPLTALAQQKETLEKQDLVLETIEEVSARNKITAAAIRDEVREQNRILQDIRAQAEEANAKLNVANRRVKRI
jgi:hypothetical protein